MTSNDSVGIPLTFVDAVFRLHEYWRGQNCLVWQPTNTEVGAGTMNPATFLRVLGPEPWRVAYVEPSVRPDDSRYGDNPNRVQMHHQYQVILKPDPTTAQELYLGSLRALGIDTDAHDIRFVEDNWESPALGAWGLGWEVWLDGLEITQFTYFQQSGGVVLDPVSVEITYGLERILMTLQGVDHFKKLLYSPGLTYEEVFGRSEYEMSVFNLDAADVVRAHTLFTAYEAEARMLLERGLPLAAYTFVLKTSHVFNVLDARGAVGVTERASFFGRMRGLARQVAEQWLAQREALGFPLASATDSSAATGAVPSAAAPEVPTSGAMPEAARTLVLELGSEEIPPDDVRLAAEQLARLVPATLSSLRLTHGRVRVYGTPRRVAIVVEDVAAQQAPQVRAVRGPRWSAAYDAAGAPTKAILGFARANGAELSTIERQSFDGVEFATVVVTAPTQDAADALGAALPELLGRVTFGRSMRWNASGAFYSRPLRWLVGLSGDRVIPFEYAQLQSGRTTRGLRRGGVATPLGIASAETYLETIAADGIALDADSRRRAIAEGTRRLAGEVGGRIPDTTDELLAEVTQLLEAPLPIRGGFAESYLELPTEVLVTVMRVHQRYFPVERDDGTLLPYFVTVANGAVDPEVVRRGNEAVLNARFADAAFYWRNDTARRLEEFRPGLASMTFQAELGSMLAKSERLERLVPEFATLLHLSPDALRIAQRAAALAKADLATNMVTEFTGLAGVMGQQYALRSGESPEVARAIFEHVLPRSAGDRLPESDTGTALALADRFDSVVGLFAVGLAPKSSADPFALRRAALGITQILVTRNIDLDVREAIDVAATALPIAIAPEIRAEVQQFITRRFEQSLLDAGERPDLVNAVLAARGSRPALARATLTALAAVADGDTFKRVLTAYARAARLVRDRVTGDHVDPALFDAPAEHALSEAVSRARGRVNPGSSIMELLDAFAPLLEPIDAFFLEVFVMADDPRVKENRLALLREVARLADGIVDFARVAGF